jgi:hypothetical protein
LTFSRVLIAFGSDWSEISQMHDRWTDDGLTQGVSQVSSHDNCSFVVWNTWLLDHVNHSKIDDRMSEGHDQAAAYLLHERLKMQIWVDLKRGILEERNKSFTLLRVFGTRPELFQRGIHSLSLHLCFWFLLCFNLNHFHLTFA